MRTILTRALAALAATGLVVATAGPASAATSEIKLLQGGTTAAVVWYNSGTHNMSKGRNSFTLRAEGRVTSATVYYRTKWSEGKVAHRTVTTSGGRAAEVSFSSNPNDTDRHWISYWLCMVYSGTTHCSDPRTDYVD
ncbi:hypothetical protein [Herbidospora daliensis]|uniref:hypothetical protein n=1 Tax=Herbidospora daliensis TaxID=295585 RepID=UPI000782872E|nr:hypothetical protein [Herbidospora daliensis]